MNEVEQYYDEKYDEWNRLERHKIEFDMTKRFLDEYIKGTELEIFDIGGGPGRYAMYLAEKDHRVTLLDLSQRNLEVAREKAGERNIVLEEYIHGNALELNNFEQKYDVILLMGPLYHLIKACDRKKAVEGALQLLKPNGIIVASFISNYAPIIDNLADLYPIDSVDRLLRYLAVGENKEIHGFTSAYFTSHQEAKALMNSFGLSQLVFAGLENILVSKEQEINKLDDEEYYKWLEIAYHLSTDENVMGTSQHYLYIGRK